MAASQSQAVYTSPFHDLASAFAGFAGMAGDGVNTELGYAASYVVPSVLFEDVTVKAPTGDLPKPPLSPPPWAKAP